MQRKAAGACFNAPTFFLTVISVERDTGVVQKKEKSGEDPDVSFLDLLFVFGALLFYSLPGVWPRSWARRASFCGLA